MLGAGSDRRIHHGINCARDAIYKAGKSKAGCGILDLDFMAGFDWLDMSWVYMVLAKKGVSQEIINRIERRQYQCGGGEQFAWESFS